MAEHLAPTLGRPPSLTDRAAAGILWTLTGTGGQTILKLGVLMVLARLLTPADFGVVGAAAVVVTFLGVFGKLGVAQALVQLPELTRDHLCAGFHLSLGLGLAAGLLIYFGAATVEALFQIDGLAAPVAVLALILPLTGLHQVSEALIQRDLRFRALAMVKVASYGVGYGAVSVVLALLGFGVWALVAGHVASHLITAIALIVVQPPPLALFVRGQAYGQLMRFGGGHALAEIGRSGAYQVDNLVVGRFLGAEALGLYGRAFQVVTMPTKLVGSGLAKVMFPIMAQVQSDRERLARSFILSLGGVVLICLPMSAFLAMLAPELVIVILGRQWEMVILPFQVFCACVTFRVAYRLCEALTRACGAVYRLAWRQWLYMFLVVIGAYAGHFFGLAGVALGVALAVTLNFFITLTLVHLLVRISFYKIAHLLMRHAFIAVIIFLQIFAILFLLRTFEISEFLRLLVAGGATCGLYLIAGRQFLRLFGEEGATIDSLIRRRFKSKKLPRD